MRSIGPASWIALALLSMASPACGWHGAGHMVTAMVAYHSLGSKKAHRVADVLRQHPDYSLWMSAKPASVPEDAYLFMKASTWPDDIRSPTHPSHKYDHPTWHYANAFFANLADQAVPAPEPGQHIQEAMKVNEEALQTGTPSQRAVALCWIFHLVGDIQQPLHSGALLTKEYPEGDRGGNSFFVVASHGKTNLHSFWDGFWDRETRPSGAASGSFDVDAEKIDSIAKRILKEHGRKSLPDLKKHATFESWVEESGELAKREAYRWDDLVAGRFAGGTSSAAAVPLPAGYEDQSRKVGETRLAAGGYRLADEMKAFMRWADHHD